MSGASLSNTPKDECCRTTRVYRRVYRPGLKFNSDTNWRDISTDNSDCPMSSIRKNDLTMSRCTTTMTTVTSLVTATDETITRVSTSRVRTVVYTKRKTTAITAFLPKTLASSPPTRTKYATTTCIIPKVPTKVQTKATTRTITTAMTCNATTLGALTSATTTTTCARHALPTKPIPETHANETTGIRPERSERTIVMTHVRFDTHDTPFN